MNSNSTNWIFGTKMDDDLDINHDWCSKSIDFEVNLEDFFLKKNLLKSPNKSFGIACWPLDKSPRVGRTIPRGSSGFGPDESPSTVWPPRVIYPVVNKQSRVIYSSFFFLIFLKKILPSLYTHSWSLNM